MRAMGPPQAREERTIGLAGATGVGVGAIVGGGILVLAGVAYAEAGPAAVVAFALNAVLAYLAAFSFAELSTRFPENGGTYAYAKKVLSVRSAFATGWVLWFAHIVTAVLYALGFATFSAIALVEVLAQAGIDAPAWVTGRHVPMFLAIGATAAYTLALARRAGGGGQWANIGKVLVFLAIIVGGLVALVRQPIEETGAALTPFMPGGLTGLLTAMGFTFITLQGVGLIAAVGGEIKDPSRTIPRSMFVSLSIAVALYLPLVFLVAAVGVEPGQSIQGVAAADQDAAFPEGVRRFLGTGGYWLVMIAAILSTLSALSANLLVASRVALSMARDRTLPPVLARMHASRGTPVLAVYATSVAVVAVLFLVGDLAAAGAAASLIFLVAYVLTHVTAYLARLRGGARPGAFRSPLFPLIPLAGAIASGVIAAFQAIRVPDAGGIAFLWLGLGVLLYLALFKSGAETSDESAEALDPSLVQLRGKSPLVLVPIANPAHARSMVEIANALAPSEVARVLLLSIVPPPRGPGGSPLDRLADAQQVVKEALEASFAAGHAPIAMISAAEPWQEIRRIAEEHACGSLLLGLGPMAAEAGRLESEIEQLVNQVDCDVAILRADPGWRLGEARRLMVPVAGRGDEHGLRARVIGSLTRDVPREITFVTVVPPGTRDSELTDTRRALTEVAGRVVRGEPRIEILQSADPPAALIAAAAEHDLVVLGLKAAGWGRKVIGPVALRIAREAPCASILLSRRRAALPQAVYRPLRSAISAALVPGREAPAVEPPAVEAPARAAEPDPS